MRALLVAPPLLLVASCSPSSGAPPPATPGSAAAPGPPSTPDGVVYGAAGGVGFGGARPPGSKVVSPGLAALASIEVGFAARQWAVIGLRVDASTVNGDGAGDVGAHLALFPAGDATNSVRSFQLFVDGCVGGPLSASTTGSSGVAAVGRVGVAWERWNIVTASLGPFLAGQITRSSGDSQAAALVGLSVTFSNTPRQTPK